MGIGYQIGNISTNSTACADDIALVSNQLDQTQIRLAFLMFSSTFARMFSFKE
jgi:hypothetical protein